MGGNLVMKISMGGQGFFLASLIRSELNLKHELMKHFDDVYFVKPNASRSESTEMYLVSLGYLKPRASGLLEKKQTVSSSSFVSLLFAAIWRWYRTKGHKRKEKKEEGKENRRNTTTRGSSIIIIIRESNNKKIQTYNLFRGTIFDS